MKKAISLFTSLLLLIGCTACANTPASSNPPSSSVQSADGSSGTEGAKNILPYEGEEIVYKGLSSDQAGGNEDNDCGKEFQKWVGNVRIEWDLLSNDDMNDRVRTRVAGGEIPDFVNFTDPSSMLQDYSSILGDVFLDFNDYLDYMPNVTGYLDVYPNMNSVLGAGGERYFCFGVQPSDGSGENWFANMDVLSAAGQKTPETWEEFLEVCRAVKANDPSITPWQTYWNLDYTMGWMARMLGVNGATLYWDDAAKKMQSAYLADNGAGRKKLIEFMATLYREKLINQEIASMSFEQEQSAMATGKWAFTACYNDSLEAECYKIDEKDELPINVEAMLPPKSPDGKRYMVLTYTTGSAPWWVVGCSKKIKNPEIAAAYIDKALSPEAANLVSYGIEGTHFTVVDGKMVYKEGLDKKTAGIEFATQLVYINAMGAEVPRSNRKLGQTGYDLTQKGLADGTLTGVWNKASVSFSEGELKDQVTEMKNIYDTFVSENEAKFIYGQRDMSEWDAYVAELRNMVDLEKFVELYNKGDIKLNDGKRIYMTADD